MENENLTPNFLDDIYQPQTPKTEPPVPEAAPSTEPTAPAPKKTNKNNLLVIVVGLTAFLFGGAFMSSFPITKEEAPQVTTPAPIIVESQTSGVDKTPIQNVNTSVEDIVEDTLPALVSISTLIEYTENYLFFGPQTITGEASGSGFIVKIDEKEVAILTNAHVITDAKTVTITFDDEAQHTAIVKSCDAKADLALLSVDVTTLTAETLQHIKCVTLGDSDTLRLGQSVIAIGNALGYGQSVTTGVVSALNRTMTGEDGTTHTWIQTDAAINAGNSGGVLLDMNGRVVGINEAKIADTEVEGMGFAIPITYALATIDELSAVEAQFPVAEEKRGKLGISCVEISAQDSALYGMPQGIMVREITPDGGAALAGILPNDIIVKVNTTETTTMKSLTSVLSFCPQGEEVEVFVKRNHDGQWVDHRFIVTLK